MLFAVIFTDKPGLGALRARHLEAHIDCGLRQDIEVLHWSKALERKVLV